MKVIVIGAGPTGLSCAYQLAKNGIDVVVYEASSNAGGMARSFDLWGQRVDCGPHRFFSKDKRINDFFFEIIQDDFSIIKRQTRIYYKHRFFNYPLKAFNVLTKLNVIEVFKILISYFKEQFVLNKKPNTFEEWVINKFGKRLYNIFFKNYSEKLWGISCSKVDMDWASQRIKKFSLFEAIIYSIPLFRNSHATLLKEFAYPNHGSGRLYEKIVDILNTKKSIIYFDSPVKKVLLDKGKAYGIELLSGKKVSSDYVISTMPITQLVQNFPNVPETVLNASNNLFFRNTTLVYLEVNALNLFTDNWLYIHDEGVRHGRITNFRNWSPTLYADKQTTILCMEYWSFNNDELWQLRDEELSLLAKKEIRQIGVIPSDIEILNTHVVRIPNCYPVYNIGYRTHLGKIVDFLNTIENLIPIGRYGAFKYNNQDHSILMGLLAAEKIVNKSNIDIWNVNTGDDYHES